MSEIDWSTAPEGATHYCQGLFYRWIGFSDPLLCCRARGWVNSGSWHKGEIKEKDMIPRPTNPEWVDGLPPVGCECELLRSRIGNPEWVPVKITARGERVTVFRRLSRAGFEEITEAGPDEFRPIQTPEQRMREELVQLVCDDEEMLPETIADAILSKYNLTEK